MTRLEKLRKEVEFRREELGKMTEEIYSLELKAALPEIKRLEGKYFKIHGGWVKDENDKNSYEWYGYVRVLKVADFWFKVFRFQDPYGTGPSFFTQEMNYANFQSGFIEIQENEFNAALNAALTSIHSMRAL